MKKKILILGGGFGGVYAAKALSKRISSKKYEITLVDERNYFLFTPLLHEAATATISDKIPVESIATLVSQKNVSWLVDKVIKINFKSKNVELKHTILSYDYLVIAMGATVQTYGVLGVEEFACTLKNLADAMKIKNKLIANFQKAVLPDTLEAVKKKLLTITIVGAGPTGIELAGEIADFVDEVVKCYFKNIKKEDVTLNIVNSSDILLPSNHPKLAEWSCEYLKKAGFNLLFNRQVKSIEFEKVNFVSGKSLKSGLIVWTAGVKPNSFESDVELEFDKQGRIIIDDYLLVKNQKNVLALGDIASGSPMLAQVAVQQADVIVNNLIRLLSNKKPNIKFRFLNKGFLMSVGKWQGVGEIFRFPIRGPFVWILWHLVYFTKFISWNKRLKILIDWFLTFLVYRDISVVEEVVSTKK